MRNMEGNGKKAEKAIDQGTGKKVAYPLPNETNVVRPESEIKAILSKKRPNRETIGLGEELEGRGNCEGKKDS